LRLKGNDTIVAISSAVGPAARMIVRVSGPEARRIAGAIVSALPPPTGAARCELHFADLSVPALVYLFAAPRSYTGEDLVEFHIPGNPLLARMLMEAIIAAGGRHAEPGEFTARAYFSGKMSLDEAEGVAAAVAAHGQQELRAARQLMAGELSRRLRPAIDALTETLVLVEAGIDFSDEDITFVAGEEVERRAGEIESLLDDLVRGSAHFEPLTHEPTFVLVGRPNAGKSTLLNALARHERAVVSPVAGTTRDILSAEVRLRRGLVRVLDVAGLEETEPSVTTGPQADISRRMQEQAKRALESADRVILLRDVTDAREPIELPRPVDLLVMTKTDLSPGSSGVSALTGEGLDALRETLDRMAFGDAAAPSFVLALNARHRSCIAEAREALARARAIATDGAAELIALELREALDALGRVLGQVTPDDVLGRVFASFCIGK
jgi:tRNA modification GTPase